MPVARARRAPSDPKAERSATPVVFDRRVSRWGAWGIGRSDPAEYHRVIAGEGREYGGSQGAAKLRRASPKSGEAKGRAGSTVLGMES